MGHFLCACIRLSSSEGKKGSIVEAAIEGGFPLLGNSTRGINNLKSTPTQIVSNSQKIKNNNNLAW